MRATPWIRTLALCIAVSATHAGDYYVATTGNDTTGDGSAGNPWRTVTYGLGKVVSGDTLHVGPGTYDEAGGEKPPLQVYYLLGGIFPESHHLPLGDGDCLRFNGSRKDVDEPGVCQEEVNLLFSLGIAYDISYLHGLFQKKASALYFTLFDHPMTSC